MSVVSLHPSGCHFGWTTFPAQRKRGFAITFVPGTISGRKGVGHPFYSRPFRFRHIGENRRELELYPDIPVPRVDVGSEQ